MTPVQAASQAVTRHARWWPGLGLLLLCGLALTAGAVPAASAPDRQLIEWQGPIGREHPLTGRIWEVASSRFIDERSLLDRLVGVRFVVTGESHNNPDHHQLQLRILKALFGNGRRVAVGLEIFNSDEQTALDDLLARHEPDMQALIDRLGWGKRHRALWEQFRPLVSFAARAGLPLSAMAVSRGEVAAVMQDGTEALPAETVARFELDRPLPAQQQATLTRDLLAAHCGLLFSQRLDRLMTIQRARDATMALRLETADVGGGVLLLVGYGHARGDRGVPYLLDDLHQSGELVNVLFASVKEELVDPDDYRQWFGSARLPFDYVWFTPRVDDEDPCERLRRIYGKDRPGADGASG